MKIAYLDETSFTPRHGGAATWTLEVAHYMVSQGNQVDVYSYEHIFSSSRIKDFILFPYFREIFVYPVIGRKILRKLEGRYDIIHLASSTTSAFFRPETPSVVSTNCLFSRQIVDFSPFLPKKYRFVFNKASFGLLRLFEKKSYEQARMVVATRHDLKHFIERQFRISTDRIAVIPHGLNKKMIPRTIHSDRENLVVFVGRATIGKGFHALLQAADSINGEIICVVSRISEAFREEIEKKKNVHMEVNVSKDKIKEFYQRARVLVMPSLSETGPIVTLEAMAHGLPVVGTPQGCGDYVEHSKDGFVVPAGNATELAQKVNFLLANKELARELGEHGRQKVLANYTMENVGSQILELYRKLAAN